MFFGTPPIKKVGFHEITECVKNYERKCRPVSSSDVHRHFAFPDIEVDETLLLNTLPSTLQDILIKGTIPSSKEESIMNDIIEQRKMDYYTILLYGMHSVDDSMETKYHQLQKLGFQNVSIYFGGLFEWALLQEIYGEDNFPTSNKISRDLLSFAPPCNGTYKKNKVL